MYLVRFKISKRSYISEHREYFILVLWMLTRTITEDFVCYNLVWME
jgi:hypothetical protein